MSLQYHGTVAAFDASVGLGTVRRTDGECFGFHCLEIADGTRLIEVGASVAFRVRCKLGRYEAAAVTAE